MTTRAPRPLPSAVRRASALLLLGAVACTSPEPGRAGARDRGRDVPPRPGGAAESEPERPWTSAFEGEALLIAAEIEVSGPPGLKEHAVARQNDAVADYVTRTEGPRLVQELVVRGRERGELRGHLDRWILVAERRLRIVEDASAEVVRVVARGEAYWREVDGEERRAPSLEFVGPPGAGLLVSAPETAAR